MTATTPTWGLTYPVLSDPPNVPAHVQSLAQDVDADLTSLDSRIDATEADVILRGLLAPPGAGSANAAFGAATLIESLTFTHTLGRYEEALFKATFNLNAAGSAIMTIRYVAGAGPVTTGNTLDYTGIATGSSATNNAMCVGQVLSATFRALATGTYTIGTFAQAATGAATGLILGSAGGGNRNFTIADVGAP